MSRLSREQWAHFTAENLSVLNCHGIETVPDFLSTKSDLISTYIGTPVEEIRKLKSEFITYLSPALVSAKTIFAELLSSAASLPSGIPTLDTALGGGLVTGEIVEIYGSSGCGKTQLCFLWTSKTVCLKHNVLYIDSKGDFVPSRVFNLIESLWHQPKNLCWEALQRINVLKVSEPNKLLQALDELLQIAEHTTLKRPRLIVIDNLASIFLPLVSEEEKNEGLIHLNTAATALRKIACKHHCTVLIVNFQKGKENYSSDNFEHSTSILGKFWTHVPHHRFHMATDSNGVCNVFTSRSVSLPSGPLCQFRMPYAP